MQFPFKLRPLKLRQGRRALALTALVACATPAAAIDGSPTLKLPLDCTPGTTCVIQSYVDHDPTAGVRDYRCGARTYNSHNGTDIRIPDMAAQKRGVAVLAAAPGRVLRGRDGMDDVSIRAPNAPTVTGRECGNGVVIDHGQGWTTQYCHMAKGSIKVKGGQQVTAGEPLGLVGMSGNTEFPHVHLTVRHNDKIVDPFAYGAPEGSCGGGTSLWDASLTDGLSYKDGIVLNFGFSSEAVSMAGIDSGEASTRKPSADAPAIVAYVRTVGLRAGDLQAISVRAPDGSVVAQYGESKRERPQAQAFIAAGRRRAGATWKPGEYTAVYTLTRAGKVVVEKKFSVTL